MAYLARHYDRFFGEILSETRYAETAGAAKYNYFLEYSDCLPDVTFGDFVRKVKVRTIGSREVAPPPMPEPDNILPEGKPADHAYIGTDVAP